MNWRGIFSGRPEGLGLLLLLVLFHGGNARAETAVPTGCQGETARIALDIGHDRTHPGATSDLGVSEFTYNLALGQETLRALREAGFSGAFLIGESGSPMPLHRRTQIAREAGAALFLSLHHDSAQKQYFSTWTVDGRPQPYSDSFHGYSVFVSTVSPWSRENLALATDLSRALRARGLTPTLHHAEPIAGENRLLLDPALGIYRYNELMVLRTATMPALLLESGVIVNRAEEEAIRAGRYHPRVVAALVETVAWYCGASARRRMAG